MELDKVLASKCRRKILKVLSKRKEVSMMRLVHLVNSDYNEVDRCLKILEQEGLITQHRVANKRIVQLNHKNEKTRFALEALITIERLNEDAKILRKA